MDDFQPGDVIVRTFKNGSKHEWIVQDPPFTVYGKLRIKGRNALTVSTTWWRPDSIGGVYKHQYSWYRP